VVGSISVELCVNARALKSASGGVRRYLEELLPYLPSPRLLSPAQASGLLGHLWEQAALPKACRGGLLFSPANTGPLLYANQVLTIHDLAPFDYPEGLNPHFARWLRFLTPRLARRVKRILTPSCFTKHRLIEVLRLDPDRITVTPLGVHSRFFEDAQPLPVQRRYGLPEGYLLSLGTLEPRKNLKRLLEAWKRAQEELPDVILAIAGAPGNPRVFRALALEAPPPRTLFLGRVADKDLPGLYRGALGFLYPSLYEGFGLPPLEAMATGTPVLVGCNSAPAEVIGPGGILVDPKDPEAIAQGIIQLVRQRSHLAALARARAQEFSWERTARLTWSALQEAMA